MRSGDTVRQTNSVADYLAAMGPVDKAFVFPIAQRPWKSGEYFGLGTQGWPKEMNGNDVSAAVAKYAPDKIVPFMSLHPLDPGVNDEYDRCVGDLGCKGIKMGANYQDFDPTAKRRIAFMRGSRPTAFPSSGTWARRLCGMRLSCMRTRSRSTG